MGKNEKLEQIGDNDLIKPEVDHIAETAKKLKLGTKALVVSNTPDKPSGIALDSTPGSINRLSQLRDETHELLDERCIISTRVGLENKINEDAVGYLINEDGSVRISIADGHWGSEAATRCLEYWLSISAENNPIESMEQLEAALAERFAVPSPDSKTTKTPETSTLTITIDPDNNMNVVGYGDCRLSVVRDEHVVYRYETTASWLGLFSSLGMRDRILAKNATVAESVSLHAGDTILLYTDGVDECVYETPTLDVESFVTPGATPTQIHDAIMEAVFSHGAQDNATIVVLRV